MSIEQLIASERVALEIEMARDLLKAYTIASPTCPCEVCEAARKYHKFLEAGGVKP